MAFLPVLLMWLFNLLSFRFLCCCAIFRDTFRKEFKYRNTTAHVMLPLFCVVMLLIYRRKAINADSVKNRKMGNYNKFADNISSISTYRGAHVLFLFVYLSVFFYYYYHNISFVILFWANIQQHIFLVMVLEVC